MEFWTLSLVFTSPVETPVFARRHLIEFVKGPGKGAAAVEPYIYRHIQHRKIRRKQKGCSMTQPCKDGDVLVGRAEFLLDQLPDNALGQIEGLGVSLMSMGDEKLA